MAAKIFFAVLCICVPSFVLTLPVKISEETVVEQITNKQNLREIEEYKDGLKVELIDWIEAFSEENNEIRKKFVPDDMESSRTIHKRVKRNFVDSHHNCPKGQVHLPAPVNSCVPFKVYLLYTNEDSSDDYVNH